MGLGAPYGPGFHFHLPSKRLVGEGLLEVVYVGGRTTWQRRAVLRALAECQDFVSVRELHALAVADAHPIGLTTVYRALRDLETEGAVDVVHDERAADLTQKGSYRTRRLRAERGRLYRLRPADGHRHYLVCRRCGRSRPLDSDVVEDWASRVAVDTGFDAVEHTVELTGLCTECRSGENERGGMRRHSPPARHGGGCRLDGLVD